MLNLNPTHLANGYFKSATLGQKYTERTKRILTILIIPIWLLAICICVLIAIEGSKGFYYYSDAKKLMKDVSFLEENSRAYSQPSYGEVRQFRGVDNEAYERVGIENVTFTDYTAPYRAVKLQEERMFSLLYIPLVLLIFVGIPWVLLRLFFWIKRADNAAKV